ncbi:MAG: hypothetical protein GWM90_26380, partial [Gemmatimonadetes bacterium]|nr:hypothetical protein [Gemmatimonadota bacterium]NIQ58413.1 hypothetical protein [Gemmatimonadota bacterium]NIU78624.1 hypothetical protein [Gammaproteobacteria bacterium]NIX47467.1 hypothetical protein [Gemmatimonadota bacterium]NIY11850.1 hypothetical protein [Gemmatimonadota bacterium]
MDSILIGIIALAVAVLGIVAHAWRFRSTGTLTYATLWLLVPLLGAMIAFLLTPPSLLTVGLGGATAALAFVTLAGTILVPA